MEGEEARQGGSARPCHPTASGSLAAPGRELRARTPAEARPARRTLALATLKVREGDQGACTGSDRSELAWLLPYDPPPRSPCCRPGNKTSLFVPPRVMGIPGWLPKATGCWNSGTLEVSDSGR